VLAVLSLLACNGDEPIDEVYSGCDATDPSVCALPFPSTYFQVEADTPSGWQVSFGESSLPMNRDGVQVRPDYWNEKDGFSTLTPALAWFDDLSTEGLVGHEDIGAYLDEDVTIVLVNAETGERVPFFAELDISALRRNTDPLDDDEQLLTIRPVTPLEHGTRYVVGVRGLVKTSGGSVDVSDGFAALRDGTAYTPTAASGQQAWDVEGRRAHYDEDIFPVLEAQGFERGELQLAWDFVTVSAENSLGRVMWMRDDAEERVGGDAAYTITSVEEGDCEAEGATIGKTVYLDVQVPMYTESGDPGTVLTRDGDGMPYYNGDTTAEVMIRVPCSLLADPEPAMVVQYGHGLLGDKGEARTGYLSQMAQDYKWIVVASDWVGMYEDDVSAITLMLVNDLSDFAFLPERSMQGFVQKDVALRLVRGALVDEPELQVEGVSLIDPERVGYYGNSQGGILGGGYVGMSNQIERAVLGVGGMPYAILLSRSADFDPFFMVFEQKYEDYREMSLLITLMQQLWDPAEGAGWAWQMNQAPMDDNPPKDILLQVAIGDAQVTTLGAHIMARAYGATTIAPETRPVYGVAEQEAPYSGSGLVEWYYPDGAEEPIQNKPPDDALDTHECPRREPAAQDQLRDFLEDGVINQYCEGACEGVREGFCD
jgi:hypothetical protein